MPKKKTKVRKVSCINYELPINTPIIIRKRGNRFGYVLYKEKGVEFDKIGVLFHFPFPVKNVIGQRGGMKYKGKEVRFKKVII